MRHFGTVGMFCLYLLWLPQTATANCLIIDRLDQLIAVQARLARDPNSSLFATDLRQLRVMSSGLSNADTLDAVDGNSFTGHGADFIRFLQNTQTLLQRASLDDPQSVRPHFTNAVRRNLGEVSGHLQELRCNRDQIAIDTVAFNNASNSGDSDAEDLAEVAETLSALAKEALEIKNIALFAIIIGSSFTIMRILRKWLIIRKRRAKRHNTAYATLYKSGTTPIKGTLLDINCYGTKIRHEKGKPLQVGVAVEIAIEDFFVEGTVVWSNDHYSGIQFKRSIDLEAVDFVCSKTSGAQLNLQTKTAPITDAVP